jgi:hypothetical protein
MTCSRLTPKVSSSSQSGPSLRTSRPCPSAYHLTLPCWTARRSAPWTSKGPGPPSPPRLLPAPPRGTRLARGFPFCLRCPQLSLLLPHPARHVAPEGWELAALRPRRHRVSSPCTTLSWKWARTGPLLRHLYRLRLRPISALSPRPRPRTQSTPFLTFLACRT